MARNGVTHIAECGRHLAVKSCLAGVLETGRSLPNARNPLRDFHPATERRMIRPPMGQYRVEFLDIRDETLHLVAAFENVWEARQELRDEWKRWIQLSAGPHFRHEVSQLEPDRFRIESPSGQVILYRIREVTG